MSHPSPAALHTTALTAPAWHALPPPPPQRLRPRPASRYASILLGTTNVVASIPGIVGVAAVGALLDVTHSWALSLFVPSVTCFAIGTAIFTLFGSADPVDLDDPALNEQFPWEAALGIKPPEPLEVSHSVEPAMASHVP